MAYEKKEPTKPKLKPECLEDAEAERLMMHRQSERVEKRIECMSHRLFKSGASIADGVIFEEEDDLNKAIKGLK